MAAEYAKLPPLCYWKNEDICRASQPKQMEDCKELVDYLNTIEDELAFHGTAHDPFFRYESTARPFPTPRQGYAFVGEAIGSDGQREDHWQILREYEQNPWRRLRFACKRQILALRLRLLGRIG